ncbi:MAG: chromate transporter [Betaproteobacteria bacterium]|nr:chromate transporter [Betaproteobacteria bacterium]NBU49905.1 chromate transporter [Betaproteobacteria bacterium]NBX95733.1 chromate transporter [Betaproteobacteria bacterium]
MSLDQAWALLAFELSLSLLSVGGVIVLASEQHRFLVLQQGWLTDQQFQASIALAQAAPGPNALFLALWGWHVGLNAGAASGVPGLAWGSALAGAGICLMGTLLPTSVLTLAVGRLTQRHGHLLGVKALRSGLAPVVVGAMLSTALILARAPSAQDQQPWLWMLAAAAAWLVWRSRTHLLVLLAGGAVAGMLLEWWRPLSPA